VARLLLERLVPSSAIRWVALLPLLAAQFAALSIYLPRALARTEFRAVELTAIPSLPIPMAGLFSSAARREDALLEEMTREMDPRIHPGLLAERSLPSKSVSNISFT